jgi:hypothetical protein
VFFFLLQEICDNTKMGVSLGFESSMVIPKLKITQSEVLEQEQFGRYGTILFHECRWTYSVSTGAELALRVFEVTD